MKNLKLKNIVLNLIGIFLYCIMIFFILWTKNVRTSILVFLCLEIYTVILLLYSGRKILSVISIINIIIPLHIVFFLINIIFKGNLIDKSEITEEVVKYNAYLIIFAKLNIFISIYLVVMAILESQVKGIFLNFEVILGFILGIFCTNPSSSHCSSYHFYLHTPLFIITLILVVIHYIFLIAVIIYFIKRRKPLKAFGIFIFNFLTFSLYALVELKIDKSNLKVEQTHLNDFASVEKNNKTIKSYVIINLILKMFAIILLILLLTVLSSYRYRYLFNINQYKLRNDDSSMSVRSFTGTANINQKLLQTTGPGLYTIEGSKPIAPSSYMIFLEGVDTMVNASHSFYDYDENKLVFYNLPVGDEFSSGIRMNSIFDSQKINITKQESYIEDDGVSHGVYRFNYDEFKDELRLIGDDYFNIYLYTKRDGGLNIKVTKQQKSKTYEVQVSKKNEYPPMIDSEYSEEELLKELKQLENEETYVMR